MHKHSARRLLAAIVATAVCSVATIVGTVTPAHAAASGYLLIKGTGSVYTSNDIVNLGMTPGTTKTVGLKVVNTGSLPQQFKLTVNNASSQMASELFLGSTKLPSTYYTALVAPGKSLALSLKLTVAQAAPAAEYLAAVALRDPETNTAIDLANADANVTYQTGNTRNDVFVKTGSQPYVGGSIGQFTTATALKPGNTATFTIRLQNNGGTPAAIGVQTTFSNPCGGSLLVVVKQGTQNVTAAVTGGSYNTGPLAPGARKDLKLTVKLLTAVTCTYAYFGFTASGADPSHTSYAHVVTGV